jgi:Domain of unknown function DUF29
MTDTRYEVDFYQWTQAQAAALRSNDLGALDLEHLAEEIESIGASERRAIRSHLCVLLMHRLKWTYQPDKRSESWRSSMYTARVFIEETVQDSPILRGFLPEALGWAYPRARTDVAVETGLPLATFPETCPWPLERVLDEDFFPEEAAQ